MQFFMYVAKQKMFYIMIKFIQRLWGVSYIIIIIITFYAIGWIGATSASKIQL